MSEHLNIKNVLLKEFKETRKSNTLKVVFPLTNKIADKFGWPRELQASQWTPEEGEDQFKAVKLDLIPQNPELEHNKMVLECNGLIYDFSIVRKQLKDGKNAQKAKKMMTEVSATVSYADEFGAQNLSQFMRGSKRAEMHLVYELNPVQEDLPGAQTNQMELPEGVVATEEQREAVAEMPEGGTVEIGKRRKAKDQ